MLAAQIHHYGIAVLDLEGSVTWYREKLGFDVEKRFALPEAYLEIVKLITPTGVRIELLKSSRGDIEQRDGRGPDEPGGKHICFEVADIEQAAQEIRRQGIVLLQEPKVIEASREKNCWISDPEGNLIEFIEELD
jgi:catechol 2,3-dioxygenase-like lactoylglutathione lyase family enzyme